MKYKGCIMEIRENTMVVMTTDCSFCQIKKKEKAYAGMEIEFQHRDIIPDKKKFSTQFFAVAAAVLLIIGTSVYGFQYWNFSSQSVALVTIDINPSIQLEMNYKNKVLKATALNKDAEKIPLGILEKKQLSKALEILLKQVKDQGYIIHNEENYILVTTVILEEERIDSLEINRVIQGVKESIEEKGIKEGEKIEVIAIDATKDVLLKANEQKISVGRLQLYEAVKESTNEKIQSSTIQEIQIKKLIELGRETKSEKEQPVLEDQSTEKKNKETREKQKEHPVFESHPGENKSDIEKNPK